ncbi:hypothetical protein OG389_02305 [Streptomyces sp. NBC_00435]|uniref:hypothetical protein n=1 Tax=Streptomyces sp. NBC_00435 TaxID=2903649 RepID=UPI002E235AF3
MRELLLRLDPARRPVALMGYGPSPSHWQGAGGAPSGRHRKPGGSGGPAWNGRL